MTKNPKRSGGGGGMLRGGSGWWTQVSASASLGGHFLVKSDEMSPLSSLRGT